jgi:DNA-binding SARP family transcriptional activator
MEFGLLGTLEVRTGEGLVRLPMRKQRALLALLLLNANRVVGRERLIDGLWGEEPPKRAVKAIQVYVSELRKLLPREMLLTRPPGYLVVVDEEAVDLMRFQRLVAEARESPPGEAAVLLRDALGLWRGPPLAEFQGEPFAAVEAARLEELRLAAVEERIEADLALGRQGELVGELEALIADCPVRERLRGQLMLALYRSGRQTEALEAYRDAWAALDEFGVEPGVPLRQLERQILAQDPSLDLREGDQATAPDRRVVLPGPLVPESPFPFVGRTGELATLRALLEQARGGEGSLALLGAEAGGGKTRLIRELAHEAAAGGVLVLYGVSDEAVSVPYQPLRGWLEFVLRVCDPDVLKECLGEEGQPLARLVPKLASLTGSPAPPRDPEADRYLLHSAVTELLRRLSERQPILVVADDVHWADSEMLHLIRRVARAAPEARLLLLAAYRVPGERVGSALADTLADLARLDAVTRVSLGNLSPEEMGEFVRVAADAEATPELLSALAELTDGTPLLVCELWRDLLQRDAVDVSDHRVHVSQLTELRGADRIRDLVRHRLSRLTPQTASLLDLAATAGPRFELRVLSAASVLESGALLAAIDEASDAGILEELPQQLLAFRFTHELVRRAVYDRIDGRRRAELHLQIGNALEHIHAPDLEAFLPELANHFIIAAPLGDGERAARYALLAGERALGLDTSKALSLLDQARALTPERNPDYPLVLLRWADAATHAGQLRDAAGALDQAASSFEELGDALHAAEAFRKLGFIRRRLAEPGWFPLLERSVALLEPTPNAELVAALAELVHGQMMTHALEGAVETAGRALTLAAQLGIPMPGWALGIRGVCRCDLGDLDGLADMEHAIDLLIEAGDGLHAAIVQHHLANQRACQDGPAAAITQYEKAEAFAAERGLADQVHATAAYRVVALVQVGQLNQALQQADALLPLLHKSGDRLFEHGLLHAKMRVLTEQGADAGESAAQLLQIARELQTPAMVVSAWRVAVAVGNTNTAHALLHEIAAARHLTAYALNLPMFARAAAAARDLDLVEQLAADVPEAFSVQQHALLTVSAIQAELIGEHAQAAELYADAAQRWDQFTYVLEHAYALLGQGRTLTILGDPGADEPLRQARQLFDQMGARPRIYECDTLIAKATMLSS